MPTRTLYPVAQGAFSAWTPAGATAVANLIDAVDGNNVTISGAGATSYTMQQMSDGEAVTGAVLWLRAQGDALSVMRSGWRTADATLFESADWNPTVGSYANGSTTLSLAPKVWDAEWNSIQAYFVSVDAPACTVTQLWAVVTYSAPGGGYGTILRRAMGALVAVGLAEMPRLVRECYRRTGVLIEPHEIEAAWRELRAERWRVTC
jgi:hypothetical protein